MVVTQAVALVPISSSSLPFKPPTFLNRPLPPISLSTSPSGVDALELSSLLASTRQNCLQFPHILPDGSVQPAHPARLRLALHHSTVVVSIHLRGDIPGDDYMDRTDFDFAAQQDPWPSLFPSRRRSKRRLVAFGRATSDDTLTASIYDLAVRLLLLYKDEVLGGRFCKE